MTNHPNAPSASHEPLRFACTCCGGILEVPIVLAGVTGPCPLCGEITTAPQRENGVPGTKRLFAKPPPRRELPPPLGPVSELLPSTAPVRPVAVRPIPVVEELSIASPPAIHPIPAPVFPESPLPLPTVPVPVLTEKPARLETEETLEPPVPIPAPRRQTPLKERGIFGENASALENVLDIHPDIPLGQRHGWKRWLDLGIVSVFTGLLLATVAALRYTVPLEERLTPGLPANLTQLVERESRAQAVRGQEAGELACAAVNRYLGAASEQAAASHLLPPPEGMAAPAFPPFLNPPSEWTVAGTKRIPLTDRYLAVVQPGNAAGPMFVVEETDSGPRLHAGPVTQQSANLFEKFTATPGQGEATLYVEVRPTVPAHERDYRSGRPDLDSYRFVDIQSGFPGDFQSFIACFKPNSEAAKHFARHGAHDLNWRRALIQVRWQVHREAGPWVELVKFIPSPWSGDPPPSAASASATTASASTSP